MPLFHKPNNDGLAVIQLAAVMFVTTVVAIVVLLITGESTDVIESLATSLLNPIIVVGVLGAVTHSQNQKIDKIDQQTNGQLDKRIEDRTRQATKDALNEYVSEFDATNGNG